MSVSSLNRHHFRILEDILEHRGRNIEWPDVLSLINHLGSVLERPDGKYEFHIGDAQAVFPIPHGKDVSVDDLVALRHFLTQAGVETKTRPVERTVVLIDHRRARFFEPDPATGHLDERGHIDMSNPRDFERQLNEGQLEGERSHEAIDYYTKIAARLKDARSVVLIGDAQSKSSAMLDFQKFLAEKNQAIADRIAGTAHADVSDIALPEIERLAAAVK
ncbi:MAG: hypothetical protein JO322_07930 [Candidatus Eremiobacteraeota bacterium]|nr:hypothetical protein [Candidatus Eremiobacteraeota bacterium]